VRAVDAYALADAKGGDEDAMPYGSYMRVADFIHLESKDVLSFTDATLKSMVAHHVVIIGGAWHTDSYKRGEVVDSHLTPAGMIPGVFVHANYVQALLTHQTHRPWGKKVGVFIEILLSVAVAVVFALAQTVRARVLTSLSICLLLLVFTYVSWQNLGLFFDFFLPLVLLSGLVAVEQVREWREQAHEYAKIAQDKEAAHEE
jgi:CHASE2 domain-containing sensor protein